MQKKILILSLSLASLFSATSYAKNVCANCHWGTHCGSVDASALHWVGCDNGKPLGVLWTDQSCESIGARAVPIPKEFTHILDKNNCKFGG